ncbi:MAG: phage coat protein [bacterium]
MANFNYKSFNPTAFGQYIQTLPNHKKNQLINSSVLNPNLEIKRAFSSQTSGYYAILPMYGRIAGDAFNYDGQTDLISSPTKTFERGVVVVGRANAWLEYDFSEDITGGASFMSNVASQVAEYFQDIDQSTLLSILKGIFNMTGDDNLTFVENHTYDISSSANSSIDVTTLNTAIQKACGDNKSKFSLVIMHSVVATNLENLNLLSYLKYTDVSGIQRDLGLATLNGKVILIDDSMPIDSSSGEDIYTSYVLGQGSIDFEDIGTRVPYEINRDPKTNGGQDTLYARTRKCFAPFGISYTKESQVSLSPTSQELEDGINWSLVRESQTDIPIEHKLIPIARIISKG